MDQIETVYESAKKLLAEADEDTLPDGGIYDEAIAKDAGLSIDVVQAALQRLAADRLNVKPVLDGRWVVFSLDPAAPGTIS